MQEFDALKGKPLDNRFSNVSSVKVTYDIRKRKLYFANSTRYKFHFDFAHRVLGYNFGLELFNASNYSDANRREFLLANLNRYDDQGIYTLEFVIEDLINTQQLHELFSLVKSKTFFGDSLKLFVDNTHLLSIEKSLNVPKIYPSDVYGNQRYQPIHRGVAFGFLRKVNDLKSEYANIGRNDIIVIKGTPLSLPVCAAVLTNALQTPLSHVNLLCQNRGTPAAASVDLWENALVEEHNGKPVKLIITENNFTLTAATEDEAKKFWQQQKLKKQIVLKPNTTVNTLLDISKVKFTDGDLVGNKAANFSELVRLQKSSDLF